ncbi:UBC-like protein [Flagelloscypha sp. PMI_526]|nr:UBC-like protein [Flagelloscypha sp. PMI_526]
MASKAAHKRLTKEYVTMQREPPPFVWAAPEEKNILNWHFLIRGPPDSPYAGGEYHGVLMFPSEYPFKPPGIKMFTPSGRFQPDKKICFSMSDFHPASWNPAWSVATILTGLLSFMLSDEMTTGSMNTSESHKRAFAVRSHPWNLEQSRFRDAFPEYASQAMRNLPNMGDRERGSDGNLLPNLLPANPFPSPGTPIPPSPANSVTNPSPTPAPIVAKDGVGSPQTGAVTTWSTIIWQKWRWGLLLAFAVLISRFSSS